MKAAEWCWSVLIMIIAFMFKYFDILDWWWMGVKMIRLDPLKYILSSSCCCAIIKIILFLEKKNTSREYFLFTYIKRKICKN